jgi:hypothetical protein
MQDQRTLLTPSGRGCLNVEESTGRVKLPAVPSDLGHTEANRGGSPKGKEGSKPFPPTSLLPNCAAGPSLAHPGRFEACQPWAYDNLCVSFPELRVPA